MTKKFRRNRPGAKRKPGARYANGRLKPVDPRNPRVAEIRKELSPDPTMASCPLDCAYANGFITEAQYRAAMSYAGAFKASRMGAPGCKTAKDLSTPESAVDVRGVRYADMPDADIAAVWSSVESDTRGIDTGSDRGEETGLDRWQRMNAGMDPAARSELQLVAIDQSWPHWINQWIVAAKIVSRAKDEKRKATTEEKDRVKALLHSRHAEKRNLLIAGCEHVRRAMSRDRIESAPAPEGSIASVPGPKIAETTHYVDPTGAPVLEVVRIRRKA